MATASETYTPRMKALYEEELARLAGTIGYEICCGFRRRAHRGIGH